MISDVFAGIASGALGAMGFGGGGILILYLTLYKGVPHIKSQGINLLFFIPISAVALYKHNKNKLIEWKTSLKYIVGGIPGVLIGYKLTERLDDTIISKIFAVILIIVGAKDLLFKNKKRI